MVCFLRTRGHRRGGFFPRRRRVARRGSEGGHRRRIRRGGPVRRSGLRSASSGTDASTTRGDRDGQPRAPRGQFATDRLRHRIARKAVHRVLDPPARSRRQAVGGRRHPQIPARDSRVRAPRHDPQPPEPHGRPSRLHPPVPARGDRDRGRDHGAGDAGNPGASEGAALPARLPLRVQQHRVFPPERHRPESRRKEPPGLAQERISAPSG